MGIWYSQTSKLLTYNPYIGISLGARGVGKTFFYKLKALFSDYETVWVRRLDDDIKELMPNFMKDIIEEGYIDPEVTDIKFDGNRLLIDGQVKIHFVALSTSRRKKSSSYHCVGRIIFDEFLEGIGGRYLKGEVKIFYELVETINRMRGVGDDDRKEVQVIMIANKTSFVNPYFKEWGIKPFTERYKRFKDGLIVVENYDNEEFKQMKKQTNFGKLVNGTEYGNYAIDNEIWLDDNALIEKRPPNTRCVCNIRDDKLVMGVWADDEIAYISYKNNPIRSTFTYSKENREKEYVLTPTTYPLKLIISLFNDGKVRFEDNIIKQSIFEIMQNGGKRK